MDINEKVAVITGGSRGIGKAVAIMLARKGAKIAVNYSSGADSADKVVSEIEGAGGAAIKVKADVSKQREVQAMFQTVLERFGRVDILVNNAGTRPLTLRRAHHRAWFPRRQRSYPCLE